MAEFRITVGSRPGNSGSQLRPRGPWPKLKAVLLGVLGLAVLIGILLAAFVVGSIIASLLLVLLAVVLVVCVIRYSFRQLKRRL